MIINKFLRYSFGYVEFETRNGFSERLINLCASNNIGLSKLKATPEGFQAVVLLHEYKKVQQLALKSNVEVCKLNDYGLPVRVLKYKKRWGILIGGFAFFMFLFISQNFVWQIEVTGNDKVSTNLILAELEQQGIHNLAYIPNLEFSEKKQQLLLRLPEVSWMSINISGCKLNVLVSERYTPPLIHEDEPCDIIASHTGQIRYMEVYNGVKLKEVNYTVTKGETIVSGAMETKDGGKALVHADAKIIAEVQFNKKLELDINQLSKEYTGDVKNRYSIDFFSTELPLYISTKVKGDYDVIEEKNPIVLFSKELPLGMVKRTYQFYDKKQIGLTQEEGKQILRDSFKQYELSELRDSVILNREESFTLENGILSMSVDYITEQDIAKESKVRL